MQTRRNIIKALCAIPFVGWASKAFAYTPRKFGIVSAFDIPLIHNRKVTCYFNDQDVTNRAFLANDIEGWVDMYDIDASTEDYKFKSSSQRYNGNVVVEIQ